MSLKGIFVITGALPNNIKRINAELKMFQNSIRVTKKQTNDMIYKESQKQNFHTFDLKKLNQDLYHNVKNEPMYFFTYDFFNKEKNIGLYSYLQHSLFIPQVPDFYGKVGFSNQQKSVSKQHLLEFLLTLNKKYQCSIYLECFEANTYYAYHIHQNRISYHNVSKPIFDEQIEYSI